MIAAPNMDPTGVLETHATLGRNVRADELGERVHVGRVWRHIAYGLFGLVVVLVIALVVVSLRSSLHVVQTEVDTSSGSVRFVGPLPLVYDLRPATVKERLREYVGILRRVMDDREFMQTRWEWLFYHGVTDKGQRQLTEYATKMNPLLQQDRVRVEVVRMLPQSAQTYDLRWQETRIDPHGEVKETTTYSGLFTWVRKEPVTEEEAGHNPAGIYLDSWSFSKE